MKYCTGPIKNMYVKKIGINEGVAKFVTESVVLQKDAPFYWNVVGRLVSFDYNTFLPTEYEAETFISECLREHPEHAEMTTCAYADYSSMQAHEISREQFKQMKKHYRALRKQKKVRK